MSKKNSAQSVSVETIVPAINNDFLSLLDETWNQHYETICKNANYETCFSMADDETETFTKVPEFKMDFYRRLYSSLQTDGNAKDPANSGQVAFSNFRVYLRKLNAQLPCKALTALIANLEKWGETRNRQQKQVAPAIVAKRSKFTFDASKIQK